MISIIIAISSFGLMMIYFILFADISRSLVVQTFDFTEDQKKHNFFAQKTCYVLLLAFLMLPLVVKKELKELKIASVILFLGIGAFIIIFVGQLIFEPKSENPDDSYDNYWTIDFELSTIKGIAIIIVAFSFQQNLFPMYNSLKHQTNENCVKASQLAIAFTCIIYLAIALLGIFFFGSILDENVLKNVGNEEKNWESFTLRIIFQIVLACHIPFIFFTGKESTLIMIDEFDRKSVSKALMEKIMERG